MQNNSQIGIFLLVACTSLTTMFAQVWLIKATPSISQETTNSPLLIARVVHDPDDGKAPPPT
jgi:hypothetical protein